GAFDRRKIIMERQKLARFLTFDRFFAIGIAQKRKQGTVSPSRRFNHVRQVVLIASLIKIAEIFTAVFHVLFEVVIGAIGNAFQLTPANGKFVFHINAALGVMGQFIACMFAQAQLFGTNTVALVPVKAFLFP